MADLHFLVINVVASLDGQRGGMKRGMLTVLFVRRRLRADMRLGVFKLAYKTSKELVDGEAVKYIYRLIYKDGLGNLLNVNGSEDDWSCAEVGEILPWDSVFRQKIIEESQ